MGRRGRARSWAWLGRFATPGLLLLIALAAAVAVAAPRASLDPSFGQGGRAVVPLAEAGTRDRPGVDAAVDGLGRILVVGTVLDATRRDRPFVSRYLPDGSLDPSFGGDGVVVASFGALVTSVAVDSQGRVVVAGTGESPEGSAVSVVARYLSSGDPDPSFAVAGLLTTRQPKSTADVAVDGADRILLAGAPGNGAGSTDSVGRYNPDGSEDLTFQAEERDIGVTFSHLLVDAAGRIVAAGWDRLTPSSAMLVVHRMLPDGRPDPSFALAGTATLPGKRFAKLRGNWLAASRSRGLAVDRAGRILVAVNAAGFAVARLRPDGSLDPRFGYRGRVAFDMTRPGPWKRADAQGVAVDERGRPILGGRVPAGPRPDSFGLLRLRPDGRPDPSFSRSGRRLIGYGQLSLSGGLPLLYPGGQLIAAGLGDHDSQRYGVLARLRLGGR